MLIPGIDMFRLFILILKNKKNPFSPDRNHIHHLLQNNLGYKKAMLTIITYNYSVILLLKLKRILKLLIKELKMVMIGQQE